jgi:dCMP deaminase
MQEDWTDRDRRRLFVVHAEQNALRYIRPDECGLIAVTTLPCNDCLKAIASYGIKRVVYGESYEFDSSTEEIAEKFGVELRKI